MIVAVFIKKEAHMTTLRFEAASPIEVKGLGYVKPGAVITDPKWVEQLKGRLGFVEIQESIKKEKK